jgi:hypothetical protein
MWAIFVLHQAIDRMIKHEWVHSSRLVYDSLRSWCVEAISSYLNQSRRITSSKCVRVCLSQSTRYCSRMDEPLDQYWFIIIICLVSFVFFSRKILVITSIQCSSTLIDEEIFIADDFNCQYQWRTLSASSLLSSASLSSLSSSSSSGRIHISCRPYYYYTCEHIQAFKVIRIRRQKLTCRLMSIIVNERISFEKSIELNWTTIDIWMISLKYDNHDCLLNLVV